MSADENTTNRYHEFLDLLPLTMVIAGLPPSAGPINYTEDQMEVRTHTLLAAYKLARKTVHDAIHTP